MQITKFIWLASFIQMGIAAGNLALPSKLNYQENLDRLSPIVRQIFIIHSIYIVLVLVGFAAICLLFATDLAGQSALGRFLSGFLALFWLGRLGIQCDYYDRRTRNENRFFNAVFSAAFLYLGLVFLVSTLSAL